MMRLAITRSVQETEHPARLTRFSTAVQGLDWSGRSPDSLNRLYWAIDELVFQEVVYYYGRRRRSRMVSSVCRAGFWSAGLAGVILPQIAVYADGGAGWGLAGTVSLAIATALAGANYLFDGTDGHARVAATQIKLETAVTISRLEWLDMQSSWGAAAPTDEHSTAAFTYLKSFVGSVYAIIDDETATWARNVAEATAKSSEGQRDRNSD